MPVISSDSLQLAHVKEAVVGVTPQNPVFQLWRTTGESLVFAPQTSESAELGGSGRAAKPSDVTGMSISGSINFPLAKFTALEEALAGVLASPWGECPLTGAVGGAIDSVNRITIGKTLQTFTIEKRFPNPAFVRGVVHSVSAAAGPAAQTVDVTAAAATAVGTGLVVLDIQATGGTVHHVTVPIAVGDDESALATKIAAEVSKLAGITAAAVAGVATVDFGAGNTGTVTARAGQDEFFYQRYKGATYSRYTVSVSPNTPITGSVDIIGGSPELDYLPLPGATYVSAGSNPMFTAPKVMRLDVGQSMGIGTHCWTSLTITIDSKNRGIPCIGTQGDREVVLGTLSAEITGEVYFSDQSILDALLNDASIGDSTITLSDGTNINRWDFYKVKPTAGQVAAGGAGQDLTVPITLQPTPVKVCEDANNNPWESSFIHSLVDTLPTLP